MFGDSWSCAFLGAASAALFLFSGGIIMFSILKAIKLNQSELDQYYIQKRKQQFERTNGIPRHIHLHNLFHWLLLPCIKCLRIINKRKLYICCDKRVKTNKPIIYAGTHIGGVDIETSFEAIRNPCWLFLGDPREVYKNFDGILLGLNGVICLDSKDKNDRRIAKEAAIQLLKHKGNLLIYPEGAWNISENLPVTELFLGTVEIAMESNADIIPIAIEFYGNDLFVAIGKNIDLRNTSQNKFFINQLLRDNLATLKWEIWKHQGIKKRSAIPKNYHSEFVNNIINGNKETSNTVDDVLKTTFVNKNIIKYSDVFEHLNHITPNINNAFLYNKRLK